MGTQAANSSGSSIDKLFFDKSMFISVSNVKLPIDRRSTSSLWNSLSLLSARESVRLCSDGYCAMA